MKLMLTLDWSRSSFEEIGAKFGEGEDVEPEGATVLARWHDPASRKAWVVVETPDAGTIQRWLLKWSDYCDWETNTVIDDAEVAEIINEELSFQA